MKPKFVSTPHRVCFAVTRQINTFWKCGQKQFPMSVKPLGGSSRRSGYIGRVRNGRVGFCPDPVAACAFYLTMNIGVGERAAKFRQKFGMRETCSIILTNDPLRNQDMDAVFQRGTTHVDRESNFGGVVPSIFGKL